MTFSLSRVTDLFPVSSSWLQVYNLLFTDLILDLLSIGGRASFLHRASCCWASTYEWREMTSDSCFWFVPLWSGSRVPHSWFPCLKNQADTKDLTSSSKFSGSCVHTLQTHPPYDLEHASLRSVHTTRWLVDTRGERVSDDWSTNEDFMIPKVNDHEISRRSPVVCLHLAARLLIIQNAFLEPRGVGH